MKNRNFAFGLCIGVLLTITFGLLVAAIEDSKAYTVRKTDDHSVYLQAEDGPIIEVQLENVPAISCFETGAIWIIDFRP